MAEEEGIVNRVSTDNVSYNCLRTPCTVELVAVDYSVHERLGTVGAFPVHHLYVPCREIKLKLFPLDANPREPRITSQVRDMQECLSSTPEDFVKKNNGMTTLCKEIDFDADRGVCRLSFSENEGVCNGGHTYFAIVTMQSPIDPKATVHLEVIRIPTDLEPTTRTEEIVKIARARNNNNRLALRSQADYLRYYDTMKAFLNDITLVSWHEGDSEAQSDAIMAEHFIRLLMCLDPKQYYHPVYAQRKDIHKTAATAITSIHNSWYERMESAKTTNGTEPLRHMAPMADDMLTIRDMVAHSLKHDNLGHGFRRTLLYRDYLNKGDRDLHMGSYAGQQGIRLPAPAEIMLVGLLRTNIWLYASVDAEIPLVGWFMDPSRLWAERRTEIVNGLSQYFADLGNDPKNFIRATAPYQKDLFVLGYAQLPPAPEIICFVENGDRLNRRDLNPQGDPTHWLDTEEGRGLVQIVGGDEPPDNATLYVKVE